MTGVSQIAEYHCNLFRLHDELVWPKFKKNVIDYTVSLGYDKTMAIKAAPHVVKAYQYADMAVIAQQKGRYTSEKLFYRKVLEEFLLAHRIIGAELKSPYYKVKWYDGARHKNVPKVFWNLFMEHYSKFGIRRLGLSCYTTYITFAKAYPAHNRHDWKALTAALTEYWQLVKKSYGNQGKFPIEL